MNVIILNPRHGGSRTLHLPAWLRYLALTLAVLLPVALGVGSYYLSYHLDQPLFSDDIARQWQRDVASQQQALAEVSRRSDEELRALTLRLAQMQARLLRLDALGERLVDVAGLRTDEFDFAVNPGIGGPEGTLEAGGDSYQPPAFVDAVAELSATLARRESQLNILEGLLNNKRQERASALAGRPVARGWLSSRFGRRTDPFSGRLAQHRGVDFAGKEGTDIIATGAGVVTYSDERWGYGNMVEIHHGNGLVTRYGHAKELLVKSGDIVRAGDTIATIGSTGRSTGPHVHYEVLKGGRQVDPEPYLYRLR